MVLFLIGFMGAGKSYAALNMAQRFGVPHIDLDDWIEENEGMLIKDIFTERGEDHFRTMETAALKTVVTALHAQQAEEPIPQATTGHIIKKFNIFVIVSVGGGTPCFHGNMEWMNSMGVTVWLDPPVDVLVGRLQQDPEKRPLIAALNKEQLVQFVTQKLEERKVFYTQAMLRIAFEHELTEELLNKR